MDTKSRYNELINFIEDSVCEAIGEKSRDIAYLVMKNKGRGIPTRDMGAIFLFMTGDFLNDYIKKRQLNRAFKQLIESENPIIEIAQDYTGRDQQAFNKEFKKQFGITPTDARKERQYKLITPPKTWEVLSSNGAGTINTGNQE